MVSLPPPSESFTPVAVNVCPLISTASVLVFAPPVAPVKRKLLMVAVSLTGMVLIYFVKRKFVSGVITAVAGFALALGAYLWLVP